MAGARVRPLFIALLLPLLVGAPAAATAAAIASAHPLATRAGEEILAAGGNAFDAAVAVSAALAVVEPYGSGLGGGGFWLLHRARDGFEVVVDGREVAPLHADAAMYLDADGKPLAEGALVGAKSAAIPGAPAAMVWIAGRYGRLPLADLLAPAIRLARDGFVTDARYVEMASMRKSALQRNAFASAIFLDAGAVPGAGFRLRQPELACTLEALAEQGQAGFYDGAVARELVASVQAGGGIWTLDDLRRYRIEERTPQKIRYHDATITTAPLPSAGGLNAGAGPEHPAPVSAFDASRRDPRPPRDRGAAPRLPGSRSLPRRSGIRPGGRSVAGLDGLCRRTGARHRNRPCHADRATRG